MRKKIQSRIGHHLFRQLAWKELDEAYIRQLIQIAKSEDLEGAGLRERPERAGDVTSEAIAPEGRGVARIEARCNLTVAGLPLVPIILDCYSDGKARFEPVAHEGDRLERGHVLGVLQGPVRSLLTAERVILNFLQHISGIATQTSRYVEALGASRTRLLDTRKTTPGFRMLEKYAVAQGGGWNHRLGLFDRVMLKDNHLAAGGASVGKRLANAVELARTRNPGLAIEVEVDHLEQIQPVLDAGADIILLDNFDDAGLKAAIEQIGDRAFTEASGTINLERLPALANIGLDFISSGALIHQATWVDIGMDWE